MRFLLDMSSRTLGQTFCTSVLTCILLILATPAKSQTSATEVIDAAEWKRVDDSVERSLTWLASQQRRDGSFPTMPHGQPGVTSLCVMAFVAHGHVPGEGPYGAQLLKAIDFILSCQKKNGLLALVAPRGTTLSRNVSFEIGCTASYNHAVTGLVLSEVYATGGVGKLKQIQPAIEKGLQTTLLMQQWPKDRLEDVGGWRYVHDHDQYDSDLSATGWHLMFLRSAKNAGFDVPQAPIDEAVKFIRNCYSPKVGAFQLHAAKKDSRSRGMAGAGILALAHAGLHDSPEAKSAGDWLLRHDFNKYNVVIPFSEPSFPDDRYHYGAFNATQAMYQLGGKYWKQFYPPMVRVLLDNQKPNGSWPAERHKFDGKFGSAYTTALVTLTLGAPNQLLPIFQR